jgi:competence protein ComEC
LWPGLAYLALGLAGLACAVLGWRMLPGWVGALAWLLAGAATAFAAAGGRASALLADAIDPALEGRDLVLTGTLSRMPQRGEAGWRFLFDVDEARQDGTMVTVPARVQLGWYASAGTADDTDAAQPVAADLRVGDRWQFSVRLKAPHGSANP